MEFLETMFGCSSSFARASKLVAAAALLYSCSDPQARVAREQIEVAREAVRRDLRDPESAEFREERVKTVWSTEGARVTIYCGHVNANNAFGGKTGFQPVLHVLASNLEPRRVRLRDGDVVLPVLYNAGRTFIYDDDKTVGFHWWCERADTQRDHATIDIPQIWFGEFDDQAKQEFDRAKPPLSNLAAPELR